MISKFYKIIFICLIIFNQEISHANNLDSTNFKEKNVSNYFSALVALNNNDEKSLNYFNSSRFLKESHPTYIEKYFLSLVTHGNIKKAIN